MIIPVEIVESGVDWPAWLSAVGTVGAVLWAIWISSEASRDARRRDAARIEALIVLALGLGQILLERARAAKAGEIDRADFEQFDAFQNLRVFTESITITDLPTPGTVDAFMRLATRVQIVHSMHSGKRAGKVDAGAYGSECFYSAQAMVRISNDLGEERRSVLAPFRTRIASLFRRKDVEGQD